MNVDGENLDDETLREEIHRACTKMSLWRRNLLQVPQRNIGKSFIHEPTSALTLWNNNSPNRDVALKMFMLLQNLLLQKNLSFSS